MCSCGRIYVRGNRTSIKTGIIENDRRKIPALAGDALNKGYSIQFDQTEVRLGYRFLVEYNVNVRPTRQRQPSLYFHRYTPIKTGRW